MIRLNFLTTWWFQSCQPPYIAAGRFQGIQASEQKPQGFSWPVFVSKHHFCCILFKKSLWPAQIQGEGIRDLSMEGLANNLGPFLVEYISHFTQSPYFSRLFDALYHLFAVTFPVPYFINLPLVILLSVSQMYQLCSCRGPCHFSFLFRAIASAWSSCPQITVELTACFIQVSTYMLSSLQRASLTTLATPFPNSWFFCTAFIYHNILVVCILYISLSSV